MITMQGFDRRYQVPSHLQQQLGGRKVATAWEMLAIDSPWAVKVIGGLIAAGTSSAIDCAECEDTGFYGLLDPVDDDVLRGLIRMEDGTDLQRLTSSGEWEAWEPKAWERVEVLDLDLAQDLADTVVAGASGLARRYFFPKAFIPPQPLIAAVPDEQAGTGENKDSEGWFVYAIVDPLDTGAVLDMIRMREGPELEKWENATWNPDPKILAQLASVTPPPIVELTPEQVQSVTEQISTSAAAAAEEGGGGDEKKPVAAAGFPKQQKCEYCQNQATKRIIHAEGMAYIPVCDEHLEKGKNAAAHSTPDGTEDPSNIDRIEEITASLQPLLADAPLTVSPNPKAEKLRRYWSTGKGGLKIRWGTPGDWKRCVKQLTKHMGVRAKGYCQNLHKRNTGMWAGDKKNRRGVRGSGAVLQAVMLLPFRETMSTSSTVASGRRLLEGVPMGRIPDGVYREEADPPVIRALLAGAFPVVPPDQWFQDPKFSRLTPLTVEDDGHVYGHLADFNMSHIGLPRPVKPPRSRSGYNYFKTGAVRTASGGRVRVGQLTSVGGHAPLQATAQQAVAHYDNTDSAVADVNIGEDQFGIWFAGALRPDVTPERLRTFQASALSGDWRPINGSLELVAACSVNVPGFPITEAYVASGAVLSLVAAGAHGVEVVRASLRADAAVLERLESLEEHTYGDQTAEDSGEDPDADYELTDEELARISEGVPAEEPTATDEEPPVDTIEEPVVVTDDAVKTKIETARALVKTKRREALRARVHAGSDAGPKAEGGLAAAAGINSPTRLALRVKVHSGAVTAGIRAAFNEWQHLRGSNGRFINMGGRVTVTSKQGVKKRGVVTNLSERGPEITYLDKTKEVIPVAEVERRIEPAQQSVAELEAAVSKTTVPMSGTKREGMGDIPLDPGSVKDMLTPGREGDTTAARYLVQAADGSWSWTPERQALHDQIIEHWLTHDTEGKNPVTRNRVANPVYNLLGGGPAAGKSTMVNEGGIPELTAENPVMINADEMKGELPEYNALNARGDKASATLAHEESSYLAKRLQAAAFERGYNATLDGTGDGSVAGLKKKIDAARAAGYQVNGFYVTVPTDVAVVRSVARGIKTKRVVGEHILRATHVSVSQILPQAFKEFDNVQLFDSTNALTKVMSYKRDGDVQEILDQGLWDSFTAKGTEDATREVAERAWQMFSESGDTSKTMVEKVLADVSTPVV